MKRSLLFLVLSLLMTGSAFAECILYIDDFTVTPDQLGTEIELCIKAEFSARLNSWQVDLTYPEGITPLYADLGADGYIPYLNASGNTRTCTPTFLHNDDYTRLVALVSDVGYWYDNSGDLTSYGVIKWEGGSYEEMVILHVQVSSDFQGGEIIMETSCGSGSDARGGTIRENGDHGVFFTRVCNVGVSAPEAYACYTPSNTTLTFYYDSQRSSRPGTTYDLNGLGWQDDGTYSSVTRVVFDSSFAHARPTSTYAWFFQMGNLRSITGMNYLNTSEVTDMSFMFANCQKLTSLDVSGFNTDNVTDMTEMFAATGLTSLNLSSFNTSNVTDMTAMFYGCVGLTSLDLSSFNTKWVTSMGAMFAECSSLRSVDVSSFSTANVTSMTYMFYDCLDLTGLDLSNFNTAQVTNMYAMFANCSNLRSLDVSSFNTPNVKNTCYMFSGLTQVTRLVLTGFKTAQVTDMSYMFEECESLTTIIVGSGWNTSSVVQSIDMFFDCPSLIGGQGTTYDEDHVDVAYAHIDGGSSNPGYFTGSSEAYAVYTSSNTTLTFYYDTERNNRAGTTYDLNIGTDDPEWQIDGISEDVTRVVFNSSFANARPRSTFAWFLNMDYLRSIVGMQNYLNTSEVTDMSYMFTWCQSLTSVNVSGFNTSKVTSMEGMFALADLRSLDLSNFNTANVTSMSYMFYGCGDLTNLNLSAFNTSKVTDMEYMFYGSGLTSLDLSGFNTSKVTSMEGMFAGCSRLSSLDVSSFNTANVINTCYMFYELYQLTSLDLTSFNTAKVTDMSSMFQGCESLTTILVGSGWNTSSVIDSGNMFLDCTSIRGGQGTTYDANHVDVAYAHIDGGPSNPGYLTGGLVVLRGDVNGDGQVNITDATALIMALLNENFSNIIEANADMNGDGFINITDATVLIAQLLNN